MGQSDTGKGFKLYRLSVLEWVPENTPEEAGCSYEYLEGDAAGSPPPPPKSAPKAKAGNNGASGNGAGSNGKAKPTKTPASKAATDDFSDLLEDEQPTIALDSAKKDADDLPPLDMTDETEQVNLTDDGEKAPEAAEDKPSVKTALGPRGKTARLALSGARGPAAGRSPTARSPKAADGADPASAADLADPDAIPSEGLPKKKGWMMSARKARMISIICWVIVALCPVAALVIQYTRDQEAAADKDRVKIQVDKNEVERSKIKVLIDTYRTYVNSAKRFRDEALTAKNSGSEEEFQRRAIESLRFAWLARLYFADAQIKNLQVGGKDLSEGRTDINDLAKDLNHVLYTLHNTPGCPSDTHESIKDCYDKYVAMNNQLQKIRGEREQPAANPVEAQFDAFLAQKTAVDDAYDAVLDAQKNGDSATAAAKLDEAYATALQALRAFYEFHKTYPEARKEASKMRPGKNLEDRLVSMDNLPNSPKRQAEKFADALKAYEGLKKEFDTEQGTPPSNENAPPPGGNNSNPESNSNKPE